MDINSFFLNSDATEEELKREDYKKLLFKLGNRGYMNTLQYTYFENFIKMNGSVCNINWFIQQIDSLHPTDERLNVDLKTDLVAEFKKTVGYVFNNLFKYDGNELRVNKNIRYYLTRLDTIELTNEQKNSMKKLYEFLIDMGYEDEPNKFGIGKGSILIESSDVMVKLKEKFGYTIIKMIPEKANNLGEVLDKLREVREKIFEFQKEHFELWEAERAKRYNV